MKIAFDLVVHIAMYAIFHDIKSLHWWGQLQLASLEIPYIEIEQLVSGPC